MSKRIDILLLRLAVWALVYRNISRAPHISRQDNNDLHYMGERIDNIIERMENDCVDVE